MWSRFDWRANLDGAEELARIDLPTVALDIFDDATLHGRKRNLVYIAGSCEDVGREAARHFLSQGLYRSYAFVPDLAGHAWSHLRSKTKGNAARTPL